jgi:GT2 family glycosyltransferase
VTQFPPALRAVTISCIIPTLNRGAVLVRTIRQLLAQELSAAEIIVVDQTQNVDSLTGSTLRDWADQRLIRWVRQSEPNASKARNAGALTATGEVLLFLDDDIEVGPGLILAHAKNYLDPRITAVSGQILESDCSTATNLRVIPEDPEVDWIWFPKNYTQNCETSWVGGGNFSIRRNIYFKVGGMDENYFKGAFREESDFAMRFVRAGYRFRFDCDATIQHLGASGAPDGGSRSWIRNKRIAGWHHCVGDWYFTLGFITPRNWRYLADGSLRHFVFNRYNVCRPWLLPVLCIRWIAAFPVALCRRLRGARLVRKPNGV